LYDINQPDQSLIAAGCMFTSNECASLSFFCWVILVNEEDNELSGRPSASSWLRSSLSLLLCQPKPETARLVIFDELNSSLFERCLDFDQS
jgi:hypothetical protein